MIEQQYLEILDAVDAEFRRNRELHGDRIHCRPGCSDCCNQRFPITELEAARISAGVRKLDPQARDTLRAKAFAYIQRTEARLPCPALADGVCSIYELRPLICHKFGMPLYDPDKPDRIMACELNFRDGEEIQDPDLIQIQTRIHHSWKQLKSEYRESRGIEADRRFTVASAVLEAC